ncbi:MAG: sulfotransferase family 2 domain-containing protein [Pleurocapsa minor GSE-CHR-MK-17-07R]|jgi:hypothetical protein|nr:sulfotransferase family 2 domain-containing protein [Pleurocapsa minor GSE-CHR-MK 17-07R]
MSSSQYYFLHLPKTAGSSLREMLKFRFAVKDIFPIDRIQVLQQTPKLEIHKYKLFLGHFDYQFVHYFPQKPNIITVLRDPVERVLSNYSYWHDNFQAKPEIVVINGIEVEESVPEQVMLPLEEFIESDFPDVWDEVNNSQAARLAHSLGWRREYNISDDELWQTASRNLETIEAVGTVEDFNTFLDVMCQRFNWFTFEETVKTNVTKNRLRVSDVSPETIRRIEAKNQVDIALYRQATDILKKQKASIRRYHLLAQIARTPSNAASHQTMKPAQSQQVDFAASDPVLGKNWISREQLAWEYFIWSGPGTYSNLYFAVPAHDDHWFEINIPMCIRPWLMDSLKLTANGNLLEHVTVKDPYFKPPRYILTGRIPAEAIIEIDGVPVIELGFEVERTYSPQELNPESTDNRQLGIAVSHVRLRPVRSTPAPLLPTASFARLDALVARLQKGQAVARLDWVHQPPALADGWYDPEHGEDGQPFAWTGPATRSTVALALPPGKSFLIELDLHAAMDEGQIDGLRVSIDGQPLRLVRGTRHGLAGWLCAEWTIAVSDPGRIVTLTLDVPHVASPRERIPESPDIRLLGVAVRDIRISAQPTLDEA